MEIWFVIIVTACIAALLKAFLSFPSNSSSKLPPGPRPLPLISSVQWLGKSSVEMEQILRNLRLKYGPIVTLYLGSIPLIFISDRNLAHQALVQTGAVFADRPKPTVTAKVMSRNQHNISSSGYGPTWRLLRRNLTSQIIHPSKSKEFSSARKWALDILVSHLQQENNMASDSGAVMPVKVIDHFRFAMFCLLVFMCFGDKLDEHSIREIEDVVEGPLKSFNRVQILNFWPWLTRNLLRSRWNGLLNWRKKQEEVLIPHIRVRKQLQELQQQEKITAHENNRLVNCYIDSLLGLDLSDDNNVKRKPSEQQMVTASTEFLTAGTDTTSTALQWIMANLVKYPRIQTKLFEEIKGVVRGEVEEIEEDELSKMPYLKAVVLEGLRRHPPGHFVLPHAVSQEVELGGYTIPKNAVINFTVADMGWDPEVWEDPMEFKPERFMPTHGTDAQEEFDITGSREIKMMPFGAGRRICPGLGLALLHLEYYVANLVWKFEWSVADGKEVDLSEKQVFTTLMKNPLHARISPRKVK